MEGREAGRLRQGRLDPPRETLVHPRRYFRREQPRPEAYSLVVPSQFDSASAPREHHPLSRMFTSFGFTTVVDTGSLVTNTVALRQRIERGEIKGPGILTVGIPLYPQNGIPFPSHPPR